MRSLKVVFSAFKAQMSIGDPGLAGPTFAEADKDFKDMNKCIFSTRQLMQEVPESHESKILFEL